MRERTERKAQSDADLAVLRSRVDARKHDKARFGPVPLAPMRPATVLTNASTGPEP